MSSIAIRSLTLESLGNNIPVIPDEAVGFYKQNCMVCLHTQGHRSGVSLRVKQENGSAFFAIMWNGDVTDDLLKAYRDLVKATDNAACAVALLLLRELTEYRAVEQSVQGTTIDYWLAPNIRDDELNF